MIVNELVLASKERLWKKTKGWSMYASIYEDFIGIKCKSIVDNIVKEYGSPYEKSTAAISFAVLDKDFLDSRISIILEETIHLHEYFYIVALNNSEFLLNGEYISLTAGTLLPIKRGSRFECIGSIIMLSFIEMLPSCYNLAKIVDSDKPSYITYDEMIKELENE